MTDEQKRRKLAELENFIHFAQNATAADLARNSQPSSLSLEDALRVAANLRRQLSGEPQADTDTYHVSRRKPLA